MRFVLFLDLSNLKYYGHIPEIPENQNGRVEIYSLENQWEDVDYFADDLMEIDDACDAFIDYGDVDFFNASQCVQLSNWIQKRMQQPIESRYKEMLTILYEYCEKAIKLNTGVVIDL